MSKSRIKSALALLTATAITFSMSVGCSKQNEGERCDLAKAGDSDCEDGLVCVNVAGEDRCCPPAGAMSGDSRCSGTGTGSGGQSNSGGSNSGGASNGGTGGGQTNTGGSPDAGAPAQGGAEGN